MTSVDHARGRAYGMAGAACSLALAACGARTDIPDVNIMYPPFDAAVPLFDAAVPNGMPAFCGDAGAEYIYVVTTPRDNSSDLALLAFDPVAYSFHRIATLSCPVLDVSWAPFSMAVDHTGNAYVLYTNGDDSVGLLYRVDVTTGTCSATTFLPEQHAGFVTFGMAFAASPDGSQELLYVAGDTASSATPGALGVIDTTSFVLSPVATFGPYPPYDLSAAELTGTGDGRLFAFWSADVSASSSNIAQIDAITAQVVGNDPLPTVSQGNAWAFAFFGGRFYLFTDPDGTGTTVTEFDPVAQTSTAVAQTSDMVVGAGVSACAPQQPAAH